MRSRTDGALLFLVFCVVAISPSTAQQNTEVSAATYPSISKTTGRPEKQPAPRLLTADEGLAVLGAALESRGHRDYKSDCSHLVHAIYERAGFPYQYVSSSDLYVGIGEFRRVMHPQPGDLVAWPGHVGIAVNPAQHSFFSALRSGLGVDSYDTVYWRGRGRPHFFRYVEENSTTGRVAASATTKLKRTAMRSLESYPPIPLSPDFHADKTVKTTIEPSVTPAETHSTTVVIPRIQAVNSARPKPEQVSSALEQTYSATGEALRGQNLLKLTHPLVVFDHLTVERVRLKRDEGWAEVRISGGLSITGEKATLKKYAERQRWPLVRRDQDSWELTLPPEAIYLPRDFAVRMLARQLAALTEDSPAPPNSAEEKIELARLLSTLLQK